MIQTIKNKTLEFIGHPDFWYYHGILLTIDWIVLAFFGLIVRRLLRGKLSKYIHIFFFFIVDYSSVFLEVTALIRIWPKLMSGAFLNWKLIKTIHVVLGLVAMAWTISQHVIGVVVFYTGKLKWLHIDGGRNLFIVTRVTAVLGWLIFVKYTQLGLSVAVIIVTTLILYKVKRPQKIKPT